MNFNILFTLPTRSIIIVRMWHGVIFKLVKLNFKPLRTIIILVSLALRRKWKIFIISYCYTIDIIPYGTGLEASHARAFNAYIPRVTVLVAFPGVNCHGVEEQEEADIEDFKLFLFVRGEV